MHAMFALFHWSAAKYGVELSQFSHFTNEGLLECYDLHLHESMVSWV